MAQLGEVLAIVLGVNAILFLGQFAALAVNPSGPQFYNCNQSMLAGFESGGCNSGEYVLKDNTPTADLPSGGGEVTIGEGNTFTDSLSSAISWFTESTGIKFLYNILAAPSNFLKAIGVPSAFAFTIGAMWYGFTLLCIVAFILGRDY